MKTQVNENHCKFNIAVEMFTWLCSVDPNSHSDHQVGRVLIEDDVGRRRTTKSGLGKSSLLQLGSVALRGHLAIGRHLATRVGDRDVRAPSVVADSESFRSLSAEDRDVGSAPAVDDRPRRLRVVAIVAGLGRARLPAVGCRIVSAF